MNDHREIAIESLVVEQTLAMARCLLQTTEPVKAYRFLTENAPVMAQEHPEVRAFVECLAKQIDQAFSDEAYLKRYGRPFAEMYVPGADHHPFTDVGLLRLDRAKRTQQYVSDKCSTGKVVKGLAIGAGDGTLEKLLLETFENLHLDVSEINPTASVAAARLVEMFPGRVGVVGRLDIDRTEPVGTYDLVVGLEIIEHPADAGLFLYNVVEALAASGTVLLSTPNCVDWVERNHVTKFGPENWYHHLRAYTPQSLNDDLLAAGLQATVLTTTEGALYTIGQRLPVARDPADAVEVGVAAWTRETLDVVRALAPGSVVYSLQQLKDGSLPAAPALVSVIDGVVIAPARLAPTGCPALGQP